MPERTVSFPASALPSAPAARAVPPPHRREEIPAFLTWRPLRSLRRSASAVVHDAVDHAVIVFHSHFRVLEVVLRREKARQLLEAPRINVVTGYHAVLTQRHDVADGQAVTAKVLRVVGVEGLIQTVQLILRIAGDFQLSGVDSRVVVALDGKSFLLQILRSP